MAVLIFLFFFQNLNVCSRHTGNKDKTLSQEKLEIFELLHPWNASVLPAKFEMEATAILNFVESYISEEI